MLRQLVRHVIFERFPLVAGLCAGVAQALLVGWALVLAGGLDAVRPAPLAALAAALGLGQAWAVRRAGFTRARSRAARAAAQLHLAIAFSSILLVGALAATAVAAAAVAALLAVAGGPEGFGPALFRVGSAAVGAGVAGALAWGFAAEPRRLEVTRVAVPVRGLAPELRGLRVAHLSDLHVGNGLEGARLARLVERTNALAPDLVAITGDLFDHDPAALAGGARLLAGLRAPLGVFAVLGNHDVFTGRDAVVEALARHAPGLTLLSDRIVRLATPAPLYVAGVDDPGRDWTARGLRLPAMDKLAAGAPADGPVILLVHRPDAFRQAAALGFPLVLAGHFHGGQIALPGAGAWNAARLLSPYHRGLHRSDGSVLYVSRGLGFAGPRIRLASPPELPLLELVPA